MTLGYCNQQLQFNLARVSRTAPGKMPESRARLLSDPISKLPETNQSPVFTLPDVWMGNFRMQGEDGHYLVQCTRLGSCFSESRSE